MNELEHEYCHELLEERAAIMEYDGGLSRGLAEFLAREACPECAEVEWP